MSMKKEKKEAEERWEERAERVAEWIWQLSPHNRWKAKKGIKSFIEEIILDTAKNAREELKKEVLEKLNKIDGSFEMIAGVAEVEKIIKNLK